MFATAEPLLSPAQATLESTDVLAVPPGIFKMETVSTIEQPLASFTVTEYIPASSPVEVVPATILLQLKVKFPVPPLAVTLALPFGFPHLAETEVVSAVMPVGSVIVATAVEVQFLLSLMVTV